MPVIYMIVLGAMFAYGLRPLANKLESKVKFKSVATILSIIIVLIPLIIVLIYLLLQIGDLTFSYIGSNMNTSINTNAQLETILNQNLPAQYQGYIDTIVSQVSSLLNNLVNIITNYVVNLLKNGLDLSIQILVLIFSTYYFTKDGDKLWDYIKTFTPEDNSDFFDELYYQIDNVLKSIFYGHFLTSVIIGAMAGIGYFLLGYKYALFLGILTGIFQLIPIFGPWITYSVLVIMDILSGNYIRAIVVLLFGFVLSVSDMYIRPALSGKYSDIHPLILFIGFVSGPLVFGIVGFLIGPLILGITYAIVKSYKISLKKEKNELKE